MMGRTGLLFICVLSLLMTSFSQFDVFQLFNNRDCSLSRIMMMHIQIQEPGDPIQAEHPEKSFRMSKAEFNRIPFVCPDESVMILADVPDGTKVTLEEYMMTRKGRLIDKAQAPHTIDITFRGGSAELIFRRYELPADPEKSQFDPIDVMVGYKWVDESASQEFAFAVRSKAWYFKLPPNERAQSPCMPQEPNCDTDFGMLH
ncbi:hypothetical protein [Paenibacillus sp. PAMC21692]|uniref:hypothetical protein n=1 Tax=Paenibacillus sp. PAMC21692 TaxID=2762320 RepID=UPI00164E318C|nr:hypothetical protein [Paenibacillus sp. PAMC21692]QNK58191.1 hypothetical protein H7F31_04395 [Paenibacillus sp. PAMC21692]